MSHPRVIALFLSLSRVVSRRVMSCRVRLEDDVVSFFFFSSSSSRSTSGPAVRLLLVCCTARIQTLDATLFSFSLSSPSSSPSVLCCSAFVCECCCCAAVLTPHHHSANTNSDVLTPVPLHPSSFPAALTQWSDGFVCLLLLLLLLHFRFSQ